MAAATDALELTFAPLVPDRWQDFEALFGPNGACGGCWCMWWRLPRREFAATKGEGTRQAMKQLVEAGEVPGILAYAAGKPVGWCSSGPRSAFPVLERSKTLARLDDQPVWSIVCFYITPKFRRRGVTKALVAAAVQYARAHGADIIEGYPVSSTKPTVHTSSAYTGLPTSFTDVGFREVARRSETRPIVRLDLRQEPGSTAT